jgi:hypothetical protein
MAKDELGHGSNGRNAPAYAQNFAKKSQSLEAEMAFHAKATAGQSGPKGNTTSVVRGEGESDASYNGRRIREINDRAASELASGAKSATIPTHDSMGTPRPSDNIQNAGAKAGYNEYGSRHGYNPASVDKAISNASRYQGKVSGSERSAIHRLLKGR